MEKIKYVIHTTVATLVELEGKDKVKRWFARFEGSWESLCFGAAHPDFGVGDEVKITFQRTDNEPNRTSVE